MTTVPLVSPRDEVKDPFWDVHINTKNSEKSNGDERKFVQCLYYNNS